MMKVYARVFCLGAILVFTGMPEESLADFPPPGPHEVFKTCGACVENSCAEPNLENDVPCPPMCERGNFCADGYLRKSSNGPCVLPNECPATESGQ